MPRTQDVNWTCYVRSIYTLWPGGRYRTLCPYKQYSKDNLQCHILYKTSTSGLTKNYQGKYIFAHVTLFQQLLIMLVVECYLVFISIIFFCQFFWRAKNWNESNLFLFFFILFFNLFLNIQPLIISFESSLVINGILFPWKFENSGICLCLNKNNVLTISNIFLTYISKPQSLWIL